MKYMGGYSLTTKPNLREENQSINQTLGRIFKYTIGRPNTQAYISPTLIQFLRYFQFSIRCYSNGRAKGHLVSLYFAEYKAFSCKARVQGSEMGNQRKVNTVDEFCSILDEYCSRLLRRIQSSTRQAKRVTENGKE